MTRMIALGAALIVVAFLAVTLMLGRGDDSADKFAQCRSSAIAGGGDLGGPFELIDAQGQTVTDTDVITEPSLLYFGYTYCPDVCPLDVDRNARAVDLLADRGLSATPVFISVDPKRDTPEVVGEFAGYMHPKMIGLTGSPEQIQAASTAYRTYYRAHDDEGDDYLVDHSTFSYLVLPEDGFVEFFRRDISPEQMADTLQCFIENQ